MKLNKKTKLKIYEEMLKQLPEPLMSPHGLCYIATHNDVFRSLALRDSEIYGYMRETLPELWHQCPNLSHSGYWWPLGSEYAEARLLAVVNAIVELETKNK